MTFKERNTNILNALAQMQVIHDKYTSSSKVMTDEEWDLYFNSMKAIPEKFMGTNLEDFIYKLMIAFVDDTGDVQKKLRSINDEDK